MAIKQNPFNPITNEEVKKVATNKVNPFNPISLDSTNPTVPNPTVETPVVPQVIPEAKPKSKSSFLNTVAQKYGLPESTLSKYTPSPTESPSVWNKIAKVLLPKGLEDKFGLNDNVNKPLTVQEAEDAKQSYFRDQRKEENIAKVTTPVEEYIPPTTFWEKGKEVTKYKGYGANVWSGFIKPAIGTVSEQIGLQLDNPKLREWGETFADQAIEKETRKVSAQSMADVPGVFEGGLKDPRYYSKTMSQAVGFMAAVLGTSVAVTAATKNPLAGTAAGVGVGAALEDAQMYKTLRERGVNPDDASSASQIYGVIASVIENATGIRPAGGLKGLAEDFAVDTAKNAGIKKFFKTWAQEGILEEGSQQFIQNLVSKFVDKNQKLFEGVAESMIGGLVGGLPLAGAGAVMSTQKGRNFVKDKKKNLKMGLSIKDVSGEKGLLTTAAKKYNTPQEFENALLTEPIDSPIREQAMAEMYPILVDEINRRYNTNVTIEDVNNIYESKLLERFPQLEQPFNDGEFSKMASEAHKKFTEDLWKRSQAIPDAPLDTSKPISELQQEYINSKPGYKKIAKKFDKMFSIGTILPEDAIILKTLFENNTKDEYLDLLNVETTKRKGGPNVSRLGRFTVPYDKIYGRKVFNEAYFKKNKLEILKNLTERDSLGTGISTVLHEFGHSGYYMILTDEERAIVDNVYKSIGGKQGAETLFKGSLDKNPKYHAKNVQEFFAQSFAEYIIQNRVPAQQMEPILKRVGKKFFEGLKRLVTRQNVEAINRLSPLFEKVLAGDKTTPLTEFANQEPPSFKNDLANMLNKMEMEEMNELPFETKPTKEVPVEQMLPSTEDTPIDEMKTLQKEAVKGLPPDIASTIEPPEKVLEGSKRTPDVNKIGFFDKWTTPSIVMRRLGVYKEYKNLIKTYENYLKELPGNMEKIKQWSKSVSKESNQRIFSYLDGEKIELTAEEMRVAGEIKNWLAQWADRLGMEQDARLSDYITHIFPRGKGGEIPEEIATLIRNKTAKSIYDPFLLHRGGAEGYIKDTWMALEAYVKRATRKVNIDPGLEEFNKATAHLTEASILEFIEKRISALNMRPTTLETDMDNQLRKFFPNIGPRPTMAITYYTRKMISAAKIAGSAVTFGKNLTQGINTFTELGGRYATSGYIQLAANRGKELKENSVIRDSFIEDRVATAKDRFVNKADQVMFLNMTSSELINRGAAYYGAKSKFLDGKITPKEYELAFGEKQPSNYKPTEQDAIEYGKFVSEKTQFLFGPLETQHYVSGPIAKTMTQFSSYGLKQTEFMVQLIKNREYAKIARYIIGTPLFFQYIAGALGMSWKDSFLTFKWGLPPALKFIQALWDVGVKGEDKYGNKLTTSEKIKSLGSSFLTNVVPMGSQLKRSYEGYKAVDEGGVRSKSGKLQYRIDKTPMNYIKGTLFGKYNLEQSKAYYEKQEEKAKASAAKKSGTRSGKNPFDAQ